ncbi:MAG: hypothetical protein IJL26_04425 [Clostridia bacterium]|nr:hypothetical protein [Clostridia bacterium]
MACFLVPGTEAVLVTGAALILAKYEKNRAQLDLTSGAPAQSGNRTGFSRKLFWLAGLLWGGVILLAFEHLWHGEIQPFFPFLTAAAEGPEAVSEMLHEMATVGVSMAVLVTAVWGVMVGVTAAIAKRPGKAEAGAAA